MGAQTETNTQNHVHSTFTQLPASAVTGSGPCTPALQAGRASSPRLAASQSPVLAAGWILARAGRSPARA